MLKLSYEKLATIISVLFLILSAVNAEIINHLRKGLDYANQSGYYDVSKKFDGNDNSLCWAFAASNQLQYWQDKQDPYIIETNRIIDGYSGK